MSRTKRFYNIKYNRYYIHPYHQLVHFTTCRDEYCEYCRDKKHHEHRKTNFVMETRLAIATH